MTNTSISVYGSGGDSLVAPGHTEVAFWAALGAGADGFVSTVQISKDNIIICSSQNTLEATSNIKEKVVNMTWKEISRLDAGFLFQSTVLDLNGQPTGVFGKDKPWAGNLPKKRRVQVMRLSDVLIKFSRRCKVILHFPEDDKNLIDHTVRELQHYGVLNRVVLLGNKKTCSYLKTKYSESTYALEGSSESPAGQLKEAETLNANLLYLDWDTVFDSSSGTAVFDCELKYVLEKSSVNLLFGSRTMPFSPKADYIRSLEHISGISGIISQGVIPTVEMLTPSALIAEDRFVGQHMDESLWSAGYSHINQETKISQDDGLNIIIKEGDKYSGAAAAFLIPIHGRFDAQVDFNVSNPNQGTTFEMAAFCIDPGYHHINNEDLNTRNVNLTFDVHGAPPYASCERDENDGFRCGWNNSFNLTLVDENWEASSVNMYNKYGRDVGNGDQNNPSGSLRLIRNGSTFVSYYKDKYNETWVCCGTMLIQNMADDVYLRLAAKHWNKGTPIAPGNNVSFYNFKLHQF